MASAFKTANLPFIPDGCRTLAIYGASVETSTVFVGWTFDETFQSLLDQSVSSGDEKFEGQLRFST